VTVEATELERLKTEIDDLTTQIDALNSRLLQAKWKFNQALAENASQQKTTEAVHVAGHRIS
jgi:hypothetical protein